MIERVVVIVKVVVRYQWIVAASTPQQVMERRPGYMDSSIWFT